MDYFEKLINDAFQLGCKLFRKMDRYRLIEKKCKEKCLNLNEIKWLNLTIHVFERLACEFHISIVLLT